MRALVVLSAAALVAGAAQAEDRVKPELGAGPHRDRTEQQGGQGEGKRRDHAPVPAPKPSSGSSAAPSTPEDSHADQLRRDDEKNATESKKRMKRKPGYKEDVPGPRV